MINISQNNNNKNKIYYAFFNLKKDKGEPILDPESKPNIVSNNHIPTESFKTTPFTNIFQQIGSQQKAFFKWILGI